MLTINGCKNVHLSFPSHTVKQLHFAYPVNICGLLPKKQCEHNVMTEDPNETLVWLKAWQFNSVWKHPVAPCSALLLWHFSIRWNSLLASVCLSVCIGGVCVCGVNQPHLQHAQMCLSEHFSNYFYCSWHHE